MSQSAEPQLPSPRPKMSLAAKVLLLAIAVVLVLSCIIIVPCLTEVSDGASARGSTINNLKQITLSFFSYYDGHNSFPPAAIKANDGQPLLSWRVAILPYIEEDYLYKEFHLDEPWDSHHNMKLLEKIPRTFRSNWGGEPGPGMTRFQVFVGPGTAFEHDGMTFQDFPNGLGKSIFVVDAANAVPWTKPEDLTYDPNGPLPQFMIHNQQHRFLCYHFGKIPSHVFGMGDGSVRLIKNKIPEATIRALITRNGGEKVDVSDLD